MNENNKTKLTEFKDLIITIPVILCTALWYFFLSLLPEQNFFHSLFFAITIILISAVVTFTAYSITKHRDHIWFFYKKPKEILERSLEDDESTYTIIFLGFSAGLTLLILLLGLSLSPEKFPSLIPSIGEGFREIIEISIISALHILRSMASTEGINLLLGEDFGLGVILFSFFLSSGSAIMFSLKQQRLKIKKQEANDNSSQINVNHQDMENTKKRRYPGSRSVIIFFYASLPLVLANLSIEFKMLFILTGLTIISTMLIWIWNNIFFKKSE